MDLYRGYRFPAATISHCVWLYFRFCPNLLQDARFFQHPRLQPFANQPENALVCYPMFQETHQPFMADCPEEVSDVEIQNPVHLLPLNATNPATPIVVEEHTNPLALGHSKTKPLNL